MFDKPTNQFDHLRDNKQCLGLPYFVFNSARENKKAEVVPFRGKVFITSPAIEHNRKEVQSSTDTSNNSNSLKKDMKISDSKVHFKSAFAMIFKPKLGRAGYMQMIPTTERNPQVKNDAEIVRKKSTMDSNYLKRLVNSIQKPKNTMQQVTENALMKCNYISRKKNLMYHGVGRRNAIYGIE